MTTLTAVFHEIVQGLTEFLPVSSSGRLVLLPSALGVLVLLDQYAFPIFF
jgi:undecaprenyl pyrophosphate phosphatase UppP